MNTILKKVKSLNKREPKRRFFVLYRGNITQNFARRLIKLSNIHIIFTTRKLRTCLPTLKSPFDKNLKSHVVYKVTCSSIYVGQTSRHVITRISEHQKKDSRFGQHLVECCGTTHSVKWEILDASRGVEKLNDDRSDLHQKAETAIKYAQ